MRLIKILVLCLFICSLLVTAKKAQPKMKQKPVKPISAEAEDDLDEGKTIDDKDDRWEVCSKNENLACTCEDKQLLCDKVMGEDNELLNTAEVYIKQKGFVAEKVVITHNPIVTLMKKKIVPGHETEVRVLDLSYNFIESISNGAFELFTTLHSLNLENNKLKNIKSGWFTGLEELKKLNLASNSIKTLESGIFSSLENLQRLVLDNNPLQLKESYFNGLSSLTELSLDGCNLKELPNDLFDNMKRLTTLSLRNNPLVEMPLAIGGINYLTYIDMSETELTEIHSQTLQHTQNIKQIYMLNMSSLYSIHDCAFCGLEHLEILDLRNNEKLYHIHGNAFGNMNDSDGKVTAIKELYLDNCKLNGLDEHLINWDQLEKLSLHANPFNCTCDVAFLASNEFVRFKNIENIPRCAYPENLKNEFVTHMKDSLTCNNFSRETSRRQPKIIFILGLMLIFTVGFLVVYKSRSFFLTRLRPVPQTFQTPFTYQNLSNSDDQRELELDFQPRIEPADV